MSFKDGQDQKDKETDLTYFGARYYDDLSGRFLAPDPVRPVNALTSKTNQEILNNPQRLNRYAYGLNNPYKYVDPDGKVPIQLITGSIGGIIGGVFNGASNWKSLNGGKWWRSVAVGAASGFVSGATGVGGAIASAGLNEIHEQTLRGKDVSNYDSTSIVITSAAGAAAGFAGKTASELAAEIPRDAFKNGLKFSEPSIFKPVNLAGETFENTGKISAVPFSSYVQDKTDKSLKKKKK